ncbi:MBOAT, membrane-bound O-acyltransferase family-domain-containing protein [Schizophyllum amplum]|uniref:O-acyltransferase n=1 Tax=Schizophyllum amplum TaxID=97359 RepID=A0A550CLE7_9AGAR|nr:MBOAT, membrane-bound O-acyltransferase family-domain-containing protein [Auriculariopsis ampla]
MPVDTPPSATRTSSGGLETATSSGTLYVSKPFRSSSSKKLRALIAFTPRKSAFDTTNELSGANEFRGFFTLFWMSMFLFTVRTYITSIETQGAPLNFAFATMFSQDAVTLFFSDVALVASSVLCVPFCKAIATNTIEYYWTGVILQHIFQMSILSITVSWTYHRQWPWVQSGFLTLHSLVMIMKMHSYINVNGSLQYITDQSQEVLDQLRKATETVGGGWDNAIARVLRDADTATALRRRLAAVAPDESKMQKRHLDRPVNAIDPHPLVDHPNEDIAQMAKDYTEMQGELTSTGPEQITWPNNITYKNFGLYLLIPSLVYELEYPRTDRIRPIYVFEKVTAFFGSFALLYTITETFILPHIPTADKSFFMSLLDLALPFMFCYLMIFYIIFECICNAFAEVSYFADRQFYEDWWNSTSWDEFSRKWNRPVHSFLLRHVYASTIASYKLSRTQAMFATFFLSACAHELVMIVVTHKIRMYLFALQLIQIPLIAIGRHPVIKRNKLLGNINFWLGLYAGFPLLCVAYCAY